MNNFFVNKLKICSLNRTMNRSSCPNIGSNPGGKRIQKKQKKNIKFSLKPVSEKTVRKAMNQMKKKKQNEVVKSWCALWKVDMNRKNDCVLKASWRGLFIVLAWFDVISDYMPDFIWFYAWFYIGVVYLCIIFFALPGWRHACILKKERVSQLGLVFRWKDGDQ